MIGEIPFQHPSQVYKVLSIIRRQLRFNSLVLSCIQGKLYYSCSRWTKGWFTASDCYSGERLFKETKTKVLQPKRTTCILPCN